MLFCVATDGKGGRGGKLGMCFWESFDSVKLFLHSLKQHFHPKYPELKVPGTETTSFQPVILCVSTAM